MFNLRKALSNRLIHAPSSSYRLVLPCAIQDTGSFLLGSGASLENQSNLITISYSILKENEALDTLIESTSNPTRNEFLSEAQKDNFGQLTTYTEKIRKGLTNVENLSISVYASGTYVLAQAGVLTQEYFDQYLREAIQAKIQYASLQNLLDLGTSLSIAGFDLSDALFSEIVLTIESKLQDQADPVTFSGDSTYVYEQANGDNDVSTYGTLSEVDWVGIRLLGNNYLQVRNRLYYGLSEGQFGVTHVFARPQLESDIAAFQSAMRGAANQQREIAE